MRCVRIVCNLLPALICQILPILSRVPPSAWREGWEHKFRRLCQWQQLVCVSQVSKCSIKHSTPHILQPHTHTRTQIEKNNRKQYISVYTLIYQWHLITAYVSNRMAACVWVYTLLYARRCTGYPRWPGTKAMGNKNSAFETKLKAKAEILPFHLSMA